MTLAVEPPDDELAKLFGELGLVARSPRMLGLLRQAWKAAQVSDVPLLSEGTTGTGKTVLARAIHRLDPKRADHEFVTVHCCTIQQALAESELFGHERGAFSGAVSERKGLFRAAEHGTVFLDDVGELPIALQPKLLDVLQRRVVRPVGSDRDRSVDVRVIAASNQPLATLVAQGRFRADLFYRLDVIRLRLPPLRERLEDLGALVLALAQRHREIYAPVNAVDPALVRRLSTLPLTGNVRELEHLVQRMLLAKLSRDSLGLEDWPVDAAEGSNLDRVCDEAVAALWEAILARRMGYQEAVRQFEQKLLWAALGEPIRTRREVAAILRISERNLYKKLRVLRVGAPSRPDQGIPVPPGGRPDEPYSPSQGSAQWVCLPKLPSAVP